MGEYHEAFVAFDVAKLKHAIAVAEDGRSGEVRFLGEIENRPATIERTIKKLVGKYDCLHVCFEAGRPVTGCTGRSGILATTAWWLRRL